MIADVTAAEGEETAQRLLDEAERSAERQVGWVRLGLGVALLVTIEIILPIVPEGEALVLGQVHAARLTSACLLVAAALSLMRLRAGAPVRRIAFLTGTLDAALILGNLAYNLFAFDVAGNFYSVYPVVGVAPAALAAAALRYRPALQLYLSALYLTGFIVLMFAAGLQPIAERAETLARLVHGFGMPPNAVRLILFAAFGLTLVLVSWRGRRLLRQAVKATRARLDLTRHLPRQLTPVILDPGYAGLRRGRRQTMAIMIVDMRRSTEWAERLDPLRFAIFMTAFRRRIGAAAERHGGVIDKFIGDGALVLFGTPDPASDDAARALACGRELLDLVARWNAKRAFDPPVEIGVGVHLGEVFCGVVGDESRLELTVLGDPVNVAARLEQATKRYAAPMLASEDVVAAAGEGALWREVERTPLRGRSAPLGVMAPLRQAAP